MIIYRFILVYTCVCVVGVVKMKFAILVVVLTTAVVALPLDNASLNTDVNTRNNAFEELILGILEELREIMVSGSDDIPVLDPLVIDDLHLELDELLGVPDSHLTIGDAEVRQLSSFVIEDLTFTTTSVLLQRYELVVDGHIPVIDVDCAKYDLSVSAFGIHVFGAGDAKIRVIKPRITATIEVALGILGGISINIRSADVVFYLEGFEPQISGLFGNNMTDDFINTFLSHLLPQLVEFYQPEISEVINSIIEGIGSIDLTREDFVEMSEALEKFQPSPVQA